jgi:hypothetical protein
MLVFAPRAFLLDHILKTNVLSLITLLDSVLLSVSGSYRAAIQVTLSDNWIKLSLVVFQILNKMCRLDLKVVQDWLNSHDQKTELFHLMLFWLQYFQTQNYPNTLYSVINELTVLVGYVCYLH